MKKDNVEAIRSRVLALIESEYESDAAFERAMGLGDKTVNNWRRGRSASFMNMLPKLSETFAVSISQLMDIPISAEGADLSEDELHVLSLYRKARPLPLPMRKALAETLDSTIKLYINSYIELKKAEKKPKAKSKKSE